MDGNRWCFATDIRWKPLIQEWAYAPIGRIRCPFRRAGDVSSLMVQYQPELPVVVAGSGGASEAMCHPGIFPLDLLSGTE